MLITKADFVFDGIYYSGTCWKDPATKAKWDAYWRGIDSLSWNFVEIHDLVRDYQYLVSLHGAIYLHPQVTSAALICQYSNDVMDYTYDELCKLMRGCAKACGGSLEIHNYRTATIDL